MKTFLHLIVLNILIFQAYGQSPAIITGLMPNKICINDTTQKTLSFTTTGGFNYGNEFVIKILKVNQIDSSIISFDYIIPDSVKTNIIYFKLDSLLNVNDLANGVRYLARVTSIAPVIEGTYSNLFDVITKPNLPFVSKSIELCQNSTAIALSPDNVSQFNWYSTPTGGVPLSSSSIPNTASLANQSFYISEFNACGESGRDTITIIIKPKATRSPLIMASKTTILFGEEISLTASTTCVLQDSLRWSNFKTGTNIIFAPDTTTNYYAYCEYDGCESPLSNQIIINVANNPYCVPSTKLLSTYGLGTSTVSISGTAVNANTKFRNYSVYESTNVSLSKNSNYNFVIQIPQKEYSNTQNMAVWLDFNRNNVFDTNEIIYQNTSPINGNMNVNFSFTLPNTATNGVTRLRIRTRPDFDGAVVSPCDEYSFGETEDYIMTVAEPCPNDLVLSSPTNDITAGTQTFAAKNTIQATNKITGNGTMVIFNAGKVMDLKSGFFVDTGSVFITQKGGCSN
jgi:GEVED domain/Ig-like domain CHU_C associated